MAEVVRVPDIGDFADVEVIEVTAAAGQPVAAESPLISLESDKATMEVPAPFGGVVVKMLVKVGDKVSEGSPIAEMERESSSAAEAKTESSSPAPPVEEAKPAPEAKKESPPPASTAIPPQESKVAKPPVSPVVEKGEATKAHASPSVRRFARELGVDINLVHGGGPKGRIRREDVQQFVKDGLKKPAASGGGASLALPAAPEVDFSKFGEVEIHPLSRINKLSGAHLHRSWLNIPHVTQFADADITDLDKFRRALAEEKKKDGVKITPLAFLVKAAAIALRRFPRFNASLGADGETLVVKKYIAVGVAVDTPVGLVVPVVRDADKFGVVDLAAALGEISARAREGKLKAEEMRGGTFTVSSLGGLGGGRFTPIVNAPEVAILGVGRAEKKPQWNEKEGKFEPRLMLPLAVSYDHRVIDGAQGARFSVHLAELLSDIRRLAL